MSGRWRGCQGERVPPYRAQQANLGGPEGPKTVPTTPGQHPTGQCPVWFPFLPKAAGHYHPGVRIAILEDDPDQLALLQRWLVQDGHDVHGYLTGREAMMRATRESFDLFVLDWQVPDVSGTEVLQWLRNNVSRRVPILFV